MIFVFSKEKIMKNISSLLSVVTLLSIGTSALAADPVTAAPTVPATPAAPVAAPVIPATPIAAPAASTAPVATVSTDVPKSEVAEPAVTQSKSEPKWYDGLKVGAFADTYYSYNFNQPHPEAGNNSGLPGAPTGGNIYRAYDFHNGFSLHWVGLDTSYAYKNVGGTVQLRFGPSTTGYNVNDTPFGSQYIKQAYATWQPLGENSKLTLDFGKYDQPFGSELPDSQLNINYTRTNLYWFGQPLYFTGLRANYDFNDKVSAKLFLANSWNRVVDNNAAKTIGAQLTLKPAKQATFAIGYMGGPEQDDTCPAGSAIGGCTPPPGVAASRVNGANSRWRHLVDVVVDINPNKDIRILANGDYGTEDLGNNGTATWYGANLVFSGNVSDKVFIAPRFEWYVDENRTFGPNVKRTLYNGTLTLGYKPSSHLVIKLDGRGDFADEPIFPSKTIGNLEKQQFTTTLGVVAMTN